MTHEEQSWHIMSDIEIIERTNYSGEFVRSGERTNHGTLAAQLLIG